MKVLKEIVDPLLKVADTLLQKGVVPGVVLTREHSVFPKY